MSLFSRTHFQPGKALDRLLAGAKQAGELDRLYWMVEIKVAAKLAGTKQPVIAAASWPFGWVPLVPVADDPALSRHYADLLLECIRTGNRGRLIECGLALTSTDVIEQGGYQVYEWGEPVWDCVCVDCGRVWQSTTVSEEVCNECQSERVLSSPCSCPC